MAEDITTRINNLQTKIKALENTKIGAQKEIELLKKQHGQLIQSLKDKGIEDVNNLPALITQLEAELNDSLLNVENEIVEIETQIQ